MLYRANNLCAEIRFDPRGYAVPGFYEVEKAMNILCCRAKQRQCIPMSRHVDAFLREIISIQMLREIRSRREQYGCILPK